MPDRKLKVFLCHASQDKPVVRELYRRLAAESWIDPWLDEEKLLPGQDWEYEIEKALDESDAICACLSNTSVSKEGFVQWEVRFVVDLALRKREGTIYILPLRLEDCELPRKLRHLHYVDYFPQTRRDWTYERLRKSLELRAKAFEVLSTQSFPKSENLASLDQTGTYIDRTSRIVQIHGQRITDLTELEFEFLCYLYENRAFVCTKYALMEHVYRPRYGHDVPDEMLQALISRLRRKIEPDSKYPQYIITIRGEGYKLVLPDDR